MPNKLAVMKIFDCGTIYVETYNQRAKSWTIELDQRVRPKKRRFSTIMIDHKLFVVGGSTNTGYSNTVQWLCMVTTEWTDIPPMKKPRKYPFLANLKDYLFVFGGDGDRSVSIELFKFSTRTWQDVAEPPHQPTDTAETQIAADAHNGIVYMIDLCKGHLQSYDVSTNVWTTKEIETVSLWLYGFVAVKGFLYIIGGWSDDLSESLKTVKRYNLSNDSWDNLASLPGACANVRTHVFANKIIVRDRYVIYEYNISTKRWSTLKALNNDDEGYYGNLGTWNLSGILF